MATASEILNSPAYINANPATKQAIFDKHIASDVSFTGANPATQQAILGKFGLTKTTPGKRNYSLSEVPLAAAENVPRSALRLGTNLAQAAMNPLDTLGSLTDIAGGGLINVLPKSVSDFLYKFEKNPEAWERSIQAANAAGAMYKDRYGSYEAIKRTFAEDPVGAAADLSTLLFPVSGLATKVGAVKTGAAIRKTADVINPLLIVKKPIEFGAKGVGALYNAMSPKSTAYLTAAEGRGHAIVNALRAPDIEIVPGSLPTAGQAAASVGATRFAAMGESGAKILPTPYYDRAQSNIAAQLRAVQTVGKTPKILESAKKARTATAETLYGISDKELVPADNTFNILLERPSMNKVIERAKELAAEKGQLFQIGKTSPAKVIPSIIVTKSGAPTRTTIKPAEVAKYPGTTLHNMKMAFDDLINDPSVQQRYGIGASEIRAITDTRSKFLSWVENKASAYRTARETFAADSRPINQMEIGQYLEGKLIPALGEETAALRSAGFASAMDAAPLTIKRATGQSRFEKLTQILEPDQIAILEAVRADLARIKQTESMATAARSMGPDVALAGTEALAAVRAPSLISRITSIGNDIMRRLQGKLDRKLAIELATEMLDPALAASTLEKALARQARGVRIAAPVKKVGAAALAISRAPGIVNLLAPENQNALSPQQ